MSTRINLKFSIRLSKSLLAHGIAVRIIRLIVRVRFWTGTSWTHDRPAILDTGSPVSLLPRSVWREIETDILTPLLPLRGLAPQKKAIVKGQLAEIACRFADSKSRSPAFPLRAYLANTDRVPLIIGFEDALTECKLFSDFPNEVAYLEFAENF